MRRTFQIPVTFERAGRKKDKSVSLSFTSNLEVNTADFMLMDELLQSEGWMLFSTNELQETDIPAEQAHSREGKTKGQRLRAIHFLIWQKLKIDEPFDAWYDRQFERVMDKLKERLD